MNAIRTCKLRTLLETGAWKHGTVVVASIGGGWFAARKGL